MSGRRGLVALAVLGGATVALPRGALAASDTISTVAGGTGPQTVVCNDDYTEYHVVIGDGGPATAAFMRLP
jgi:hypothetical protein